MKKINDTILGDAAINLLIANTPHYLLKKLKSDPNIAELSNIYTEDELVGSLKKIILKEPKTMTDAVKPYALITALYFKKKLQYLEQTKNLDLPHYKWYKQIDNLLLQDVTSTTNTKLIFHKKINITTNRENSSSNLVKIMEKA